MLESVIFVLHQYRQNGILIILEVTSIVRTLQIGITVLDLLDLL